MTDGKKRLKVLIVEDDPVSNRLLEHMISDTGGDMIATAAFSLKEAFRALENDRHDVILLDLDLPDSNGLDTVVRMVARYPNIAVVVVTGKYDESFGTEVIRVGAQDYLFKGKFNVHVLLKTIRYSVERKKSVEKIKEAQKQLVHAAKMAAVGQLAGGVAHEVKNALATIIHCVNYMESDAVQDKAQYFDKLNMIKKTVFETDETVRRLLDFSRPAIMRLNPCSMNKVIKTSLELVKGHLFFKDVEVVEDFSEETPFVMMDKDQMKQVFVNIILNSLQAMPDGGKLIVQTYVKKLTEAELNDGLYPRDLLIVGNKVLFCEIEDTGAGIPDSKLNKVFDPFFTTKPPGEGTGLGLSITSSIVEAHKGVVHIESAEGKGAKIILVFPVAE